MSEKIETGGPAFPVQYSNEADGPTVMPNVGMTLRDYFAAKAMQALVAGDLRPGTTEDEITEVSYGLADAMLKERKVKHEQG